MYLFETLHEFCDMMMLNMSERVARLEATVQSRGTGPAPDENQGGDVAVRFRDGDLWIGSNTRSHYGTAQRQLKNRIDESKHLFGVDYVWWTAQEADDRDDDNKRIGRCFGPKAVGQAATSFIPGWFGPTMGARVLPAGVDGAKDKQYRLYTSTYFQTWIMADARIPNLCNNRIPSHRLDNGMDYVTGKQGAIPAYYTIDRNDKTFLWRLMRTIEERQGLPALPGKVVSK
jgi:hypothetical protein